MRLQTQIIKAKTDLIYNIGLSTAEFSSDKPDHGHHEQRRKKWEILMKWEDAYFTSVGNKICCSEHFLLNDVQLNTHIEIGSCTLGFPLDKR